MSTPVGSTLADVAAMLFTAVTVEQLEFSFVAAGCVLGALAGFDVIQLEPKAQRTMRRLRWGLVIGAVCAVAVVIHQSVVR